MALVFKYAVEQRKFGSFHHGAEQSAAGDGHQSAEIVHKAGVGTEHHEAALMADTVHNQLDHSLAGGADHVEHLLGFFIGRALVAEDVGLGKAGADNADIASAAHFFTHGFGERFERRFARGIYGTEHTVIVVLSILGIFFGLTWFVALILSLVWGGECFTGDSLDKLEKLSRLYKDKVITKAEYERMKAKIMKE